jgi:2-keto-4-pentenoate hydratase
MSSHSAEPAPSAAFDPAPAAQLLWRTWRDHGVLDELPESMRPSTLQEGYDIQDAVAALRSDRVAGWKLGVGSIGALRQGGLGRPLVGRVFEPLVHHSGDTVRLTTHRPVTVECEVAFVLGVDIAPGRAPARIADAVADTCVTFEFVLSRFANRRAVGWPSFAADGVGFGALVIGSSISADDIDELGRTLSVSVGGVERARVATGDDVTSPWGSFAALLDHAAERSISLYAGEIITTGAWAMPFDLPAESADIEARVGTTILKARLQIENSGA